MGILAKLFGRRKEYCSNCLGSINEVATASDPLGNAVYRGCKFRISIFDIHNGYMIFVEQDPSGNVNVRSSPGMSLAHPHAIYCKDMQEVSEQLLLIYARNKMSI